MKKVLFCILTSFFLGFTPTEPEGFSFPPETILVKGGTFYMGSSQKSKGHYSDEKLHPQTLSDYYIGKYEVTVAEFARFIEATDYLTDAEKSDGSVIKNYKGWWEKVTDANWRFDVKGKIRQPSEYNHPVIHVSWNDATAYCAWLSETTGDYYHLPSEAQWEYAARSRGKVLLYGWGSDEKAKGNISDETGKREMEDLVIAEGFDDGFAYTSPVGSYPANALGAFDMTGNVWEWCQDYYLQDYPLSPPKNYSCLEGDGNRALRGGSWFDRLRYCRIAKRNNNYQDYRAGHFGFRVAKERR